jgi:hypothetical protein
MFGRNERSLGVKNGSLGRIESITATRMAVMLDDGRAVTFDHKDYAAIDHGYAATVHKAQGVTVDRLHVLATPGLDRHAAYVALSRHRESVELHCGRDDFAGDGKLVRTLSRERTKDIASDYARDFADNRRIVLPAPAAEKAASAPPQDRFAGVRLNTGISELAQPSKASASERSSALPDAVTRHARIVRAMQFARSVGEPFTADQRQELSNSRIGLNAFRPHAALDLETALANDPKLTREAAEGRTVATVRAMQLEAALRVDPQLRAETFVQRWQALERQRRMLLRDHEDTRAAVVGDRMLAGRKVSNATLRWSRFCAIIGRNSACRRCRGAALGKVWRTGLAEVGVGGSELGCREVCFAPSVSRHEVRPRTSASGALCRSPASVDPISSFRQDRTSAGARLNDRLWSLAATTAP